MLKPIAVAILLIGFAAQVSAAPVDYLLRKDQSRVGFTWFFGQETISGSMPVTRADISLDFDQPNNSRVVVAVDAANANAGAALANEALKGQSVLWTDRFPEIVFRSQEIRRDGQGGAIMTGNLTVRGVAQPQTFTAQLFRPGGNAEGDRSELTIRLTGSLSRSAFGANGYASFVGDRVDLDIQARIARQN